MSGNHQILQAESRLDTDLDRPVSSITNSTTELIIPVGVVGAHRVRLFLDLVRGGTDPGDLLIRQYVSMDGQTRTNDPEATETISPPAAVGQAMRYTFIPSIELVPYLFLNILINAVATMSYTGRIWAIYEHYRDTPPSVWSPRPMVESQQPEN